MTEKDTVYVDELLQELIPSFMENRRNEFVELEKFLSQKDYEALAKLGHKLIGTGYNYGFQKLGDLATDLEKAGKSKDEIGARRAIDGIRRHFQNIEVVFVQS